MTELRYTLEGRPTSWKRTEGKGRARYTEPAMRAAKAAHAYAALAARQAWAVAHKTPWPLAGAFELEVTAYMPHRGSLPDWDNLGKLVSDAVQGVLFANDVQIEDGRVRRLIDRERPRVEVCVRLVGGGVMGEVEQRVWLAAYAAALQGMLAGPRGAYLCEPHQRPSMNGTPYVESVSHACRAYADRALVDFKKRVGVE